MASCGHGNVVVVENDNRFQQEINAAGNRLVIVDFTAPWCGPCQRMAPIFAELSVKYSAAIFLKVDVDQCKRTAAIQGIRAMPTFYFFKNRQKVDEMMGADREGLENRINQWIGGAVDTVILDPKRVALGRSWDCFELLVDNPYEVFMDVSQLLLKFASNIINNPDNPKYRSIRVANKVVQSRLLPVNGAVECLFAMGFEEKGDHLVFPSGTPLEGLLILQDTLQDERNRRYVDGDMVKPVYKQQHEQSPCSQPSIVRRASSDPADAERDFLLRLQSSVQHVLLYEDPKLQLKAQSLIPVADLKRKAREASERTQQSGQGGVSEHDCLILELLAWFKGSFFKWVDKPTCPSCGCSTEALGLVPPNADELKWGAGNVESYKCFKCRKMIRFPRYNHPGKLLETRCGRCGEWANCFTLLCRAVGFEARHVLDWTDHVWTEVYSESQKRWLHCDACENTCDKPLLYEAGWGKKLSYIIAFSNEQVLDVTWRYSAKHDEVRQRRTLVCEKWLEETLHWITVERQKNLSEERRKLLTERSVKELVEFFTIKSVKSADELQGRTSGSLAWRLLRGETKLSQDHQEHHYIFTPTMEEVKDKRLRICYSCATDKYLRGLKLKTDLTGWKSGVAASNSLFRKVEKDWEMVYLARTEGSFSGSVTWHIDVTSSGLVIDTVTIVTQSKTFASGQVVWKLTGDNEDQKEILSGEGKLLKTYLFSGSKSLKLTALLTGGKGDVAWQHAQLFRQPISNKDEFPLDITVSLRDPLHLE